MGPTPRPVAERFWSKVEVRDPDECWPWTGGRFTNGYGQFRLNNPRRKIGAHRLAYEIARGPVPDGLVIDHLCRNKGCVNPAHLDVVTPSENNLRAKTGSWFRAGGKYYGTGNAARWGSIAQERGGDALSPGP